MLLRFKEVRARVQQTRKTGSGRTQYQGYLEIVGDYGPIKIPVGPWREKKGDAYADAKIAEFRHRKQRAAQEENALEVS